MAAVIAGKVLLDLCPLGWGAGDRKCAWLLRIQWTLTAVLAVGLPILGTTTLIRNTPAPKSAARSSRKPIGYSVAAILLKVLRSSASR